VATHTATETNDPLAQHLLLADDTPLFADAMLDAAPLTARLAVLSGCGTGRTTVAHADEGFALASAIHAAGVPGVLSSLWSVLDPPTARFMGRVVANLRDGQPPAQALRSAQVKAIAAGSRTADWAAFTFLGA
jgi:CHAT domain-containing protein